MHNINRRRRYRVPCPDAGGIEEILLRAQERPMAYRMLERHIITCSHCRKTAHRIKLFYEIFADEIKQPMSPKVTEFARTLEQD